MADKLILAIDVQDPAAVKIENVTGKLKDLHKHLDTGHKQLTKWEQMWHKQKDLISGVTRNLFSLKNALIGVGAAYALLRLTRIVREWMDLAGAQQAADMALKQVMISMGRYSDDFYRQTLQMASSMQKLTGVGDETIMVGQKFLLTFKQIPDEVMPRSTKAMMDLAALMGGDVQRAALTLGKAAMGLTGELRRVGITVDEDTFKAKGYVGILKEIEEQVKGQAEVFRKTWPGAVMAFRSAWGDIKEIFGKVFVDYVQPKMDAVTNTLIRLKEEGKLDDWAKQGAEGMKSLATVSLSALSVMEKGVQLFMKSMYGWLIMIQGIKTAWVGLKEESQRMIQGSKQAAVEADPYGFLGATLGAGPYRPGQAPLYTPPAPTKSQFDIEMQKLQKLINASKDVSNAYDKLKKDIIGIAEAWAGEGKGKDSVKSAIQDSNKELKDITDSTLPKMTAEVSKLETIWTSGWTRMVNHAQYGITGLLDGTIRRFEDFTAMLGQLWRNMIAQMATEQLAMPIINPVMGLGQGLMAGAGQQIAGSAIGQMVGGGIGRAWGGLTGWLSSPLPGMSTTTPYMGPYFGHGLGYAGSATGAGAGSGVLSTVSGPTWGATLGAAGLGSLGYGTIGKMIGLPQSKYSPYTAGAGAGIGFAVGGPIGAIIGATLGGVLGGIMGKKPSRPDIVLEWEMAGGQYRNVADYWAGGAQRSQDLIDTIEAIISEQRDIYEETARILRTTAAPFGIMVKALGAKPEDIEKGIAAIPEAFAAGYGFGPETIERVQAMQASFAEMLGGAFRDALQTAEFSDFQKGFSQRIYASFRESLFNAFIGKATSAIMPGLWASSGGIDAMISSLVTGAMIGTTSAYGSYGVGQALDELADNISQLQPAFDAMAQIMEALEDAIMRNTTAQLDLTSAVQQEKAIIGLIGSLTTGRLAPSTSYSGIRSEYQRLIATGSVGEISSYVSGTYLPFMQAYGGNYGEAFSEVIGHLQALQPFGGEDAMVAILTQIKSDTSAFADSAMAIAENTHNQLSQLLSINYKAQNLEALEEIKQSTWYTKNYSSLTKDYTKQSKDKLTDVADSSGETAENTSVLKNLPAGFPAGLPAAEKNWLLPMWTPLVAPGAEMTEAQMGTYLRYPWMDIDRSGYITTGDARLAMIMGFSDLAMDIIKASVGNEPLRTYQHGGFTGPWGGRVDPNEWVVPTTEPHRSRFLSDVGVDPDAIGRAIAKHLAPAIAMMAENGQPVQIFLDGRIIGESVGKQMRTNSRLRRSTRAAVGVK